MAATDVEPRARATRALVGRGARLYALERTQRVPVEVERAWEFFADPGNLEAITPPWLRFSIVSAPAPLQRGSLLAYRLRLGAVPIRWLTEIVAWRPPRSFVDVQLRGPYRLWEHTHRLTSVPGGTEIYDHVRYGLRAEPLASLVRPLTVERWLEQIFDYRAERIAALLR